VFAWPGLEESISAIAILGVALILLGIFTLTWWGRVRELLGAPGKLLRDSGVRYAVATGLIIAVYSVLDKQGVQHVTPLLYMYFVISSGTIGMLPFLRSSYRWQAFAAEWRAHRLSIASGGVLQFAAYGMVLTALSRPDVNVSYVGPFREIAIVFGVVLGTLVLREPFAGGRMLGAAMIAGGALTIALAP
jgi:drug/metabolite transporter (DMT)-like permease